MKLYLVQHGEACSKEENPDRPLSEQGMKDVKNVAEFLKNAGVTCDRVLHSGKLRAEQTAGILAETIAQNVKPEAMDGIAPNDDPAPILEQANGWNADTLIAGHLPFMAKAVSLFTTGKTDGIIAAYKPGSIVCLERTEGPDWSICWMLRPELIK